MLNIDIDQRVFRRYSREIAFTLNIKGRPCPAKTVDYSFNSLGIIVEAADALNAGDIVELDIVELGIHQSGKVLWVKKDAQAVRAGIARIGTLNGSFRHYHLSDMLIGFQRTLKAGILAIRKGPINKKVYIRNGNIIFSTSNQDEDRIGDILLREGRMTREQYDHASQRKRGTNERYVAILVDSGFLRPSDLLDTIALQATRIIESLFALQDAEFEFIEGPLSSEPPVALNLSVADLIYREVKKTADIELLKKYLLDSIVDFSSTPLNLFQNVRLDKADRILISFIDGRTAIKELIRLSSLDVKEGLRSLYALLEARIIETKKMGEAPLGITPQEISGNSDKIYCDLIGNIDEMHSKYADLDCYRLLGLSEQATPEQIKKAYFKAAREFHPDMHLDLPGDIKEKLVNIFSRINNAYLTLKDYEKRVEYDKALRSRTAGVTKGAEKTTGFSTSENGPEGGFGPQRGSGPDLAVNSEIALAKYEEGKGYFRREKIEEAAYHFASAIYFDSSRPEYYYYYGFALEKLGKLKESMQALNRAFDMAPNNADVLAEIGHVYLRLSCPLRAKGNFERAIRLEPSTQKGAGGYRDDEGGEQRQIEVNNTPPGIVLRKAVNHRGPVP